MSTYSGTPGKTTIAVDVLLTVARLTTLGVCGSYPHGAWAGK